MASQNVFTLEDCSARLGAKIWKLIFDLPNEKVNILGARVIDETESLLPTLEKMGQNSEIDALIMVSGKKGNFIAGADIKLIQKAKTSADAEKMSSRGQELLSRWEDLPYPTIVAINGTTLGGGCEWSLASTAIVMSDDPSAKIGLPEVMLGFIPGMGGCIRLPQKVGLATALDLILSSKQLNGDKALKAGMIEACLPKENFESAVESWVRTNLTRLKSKTRMAREPKLGGMGGPAGKLLESTTLGRRFILKKAREGVLAKTKGHYPAPLEVISVLSETGVSYRMGLRGEARATAMQSEAAGFGRLAVTDISRNLVRIFFMTEDVKKSNGLKSGEKVQARDLREVASLGAGVMGGGISQLFADKNIPVRMKDLNQKALEAGIQSATKVFRSKLKRKSISPRQFQQKLSLISPVLDYSGFGHVDLVVEAVIEKIDIKKSVFKELEKVVSPECIIASNTSSLSISEMQTVFERPERFVGMHFFNPVHRMPLIEVIRGAKTSDHTVASIFQISKTLGKTPIVVKDGPGFLVNRLLAPYLNEATYLVSEGVPILALDRVLLNFGMPMGPMELVDEVGVDVGEKVAHILHDAFGARMVPAQEMGKVIKAGRLGKKNGKGIYIYDEKGKREFDPEIYDIVGIQPKEGEIAEEEILDRCILPMINEASRCLDEEIVMSPADVDLGMIMGTGFPPFRGGLMRYADVLGAKMIVEKLSQYQKRFGARFEPSPAMIRMSEKNGKFFGDAE